MLNGTLPSLLCRELEGLIAKRVVMAYYSSTTAYTLLSRRTCHVQVETCHHLKIRTLRVFDYIYEALE